MGFRDAALLVPVTGDHWLFGRRLLAYAESRDRPTGVAVDVVGSAPMAFPPEVTE
ncbi:hypothetical protein [Nocardia gipuzkoensis]